MDVHPTKNVSIGIDPYPYGNFMGFKQQKWYFNGISLISSPKMRTSFDFMAINGGLMGVHWI
jgi:hypothetical protein